jgi:hypothetical protein
VFYGFLFLLAGLPMYVWLRRATPSSAVAAVQSPVSDATR